MTAAFVKNHRGPEVPTKLNHIRMCHEFIPVYPCLYIFFLSKHADQTATVNKCKVWALLIQRMNPVLTDVSLIQTVDDFDTPSLERIPYFIINRVGRGSFGFKTDLVKLARV